MEASSLHVLALVGNRIDPTAKVFNSSLNYISFSISLMSPGRAVFRGAGGQKWHATLSGGDAAGGAGLVLRAAASGYGPAFRDVS
jgi:hypothetical protein